jgi:hypothetical protein
MDTIGLNDHTVPDVWVHVLRAVGPLFASQVRKAGLPTLVPGGLKLCFEARYHRERAHCQVRWTPLSRPKKCFPKLQSWRTPLSNVAASRPCPTAFLFAPHSLHTG